MEKCGFPAIPEYLSKHQFPDDYLVDLGEVTQVWTQDEIISGKIADAANIRTVASRLVDLAMNTDAILLARDDAENHLDLALPFLKSGLPVYIDKPLSLSVASAHKIFDSQQYNEQVFSCSSLRFANELMLTDKERRQTGPIYHIEGTVGKKWETYGIHLLEPIVAQMKERGKFLSVTKERSERIERYKIAWTDLEADIILTQDLPTDITLTFMGVNKTIKKIFRDSFGCFRQSLATFCQQIVHRKQFIDREETLELVTIIENGIDA